ncbi:hypothetical protein F9B85_09560 [Heliorestis acidaminivorans]|uniref:Glycoside hydrolase family 5 domain-containing protein n=1 Tax=Heliorestis acidaminivorans TaxID=553427 RepID=A0A6I0F1Z0_9FIRM|nr:hypothetical protein [Heliorestis acidaminivorans]KAB2952391.1 hypothetical protein F9B85_09560 [Heliorestis acidaminivorans]
MVSKMRKIKSGNLLPHLMDDITIPLENVKKLQLNTLNVPLRVDVPDPYQAKMSLHPQAFEYVQNNLPRLRQMGVDLFLEPFPWVQQGELAETAWNPDDVDSWFEQWGSICLQAAHFAQSHGIEKLVISDGIHHLEPYPDQWIKLIKEIRLIYRGQITYRTQWWYSAWHSPWTIFKFYRKLQNPLFGHLDFISISAYFELTNSNAPGEKALIDSWYRSTRQFRQQPIVEQVQMLQKRWQKPIFFGEVGYVDRAGTNQKPWSVQPSDIINEQEQADCFSAFFRVFWHHSWFLGASVFQIHLPQSLYYPVGKKAEAIIRQAPVEVSATPWIGALRSIQSRWSER